VRTWFPTLSYDRPVTGLMAFVALIVVGLIAWQRIPLQMMPSGFEPRRLWVYVDYEDGSPRETDEDVIQPIEAQLGTIAGIEQLTSRASTGSARFTVSFHGSTDMDGAYNEVVDRLERAMPDLPEEVERYYVFRYNPDDNPVIWVGVTLPEEVEDPGHVMSRVVEPRLSRISGVADVSTWGVPELSVLIEYDREKLYGYGIDLGDLSRRLGGDNFQMAGGKIQDRGLNRHVRSLSRIHDPDTLVRYPVKDGLVLEDIASVGMGGLMSADIRRVNGLEAAGIAVRKESTANTVDVTRRVHEVLAELEDDPRAAGASFFVFFDEGDMISDSISTLGWTAVMGGAFSVVVLMVFLREWRMTTLIALSIPFSLVITVAMMYATGDSLNVVALMGLMLAVGMVVDNAIVVVETIYRRRAEGAGMRAAAIEGTAEVNLAIVLSTLTTMVVFLPIILMAENQDFSFWMGVLGRPVVYALGASLVVALVFAPLATRFVQSTEVKPDPRWLQWLTDVYSRTLTWVLSHRVDVTLVIVFGFFLTAQVALPGLKRSDQMEGNLNDFTIAFEVPPQASLSERDDIVKRFEDLIEEHREEWGVRVYRARLRSTQTQGSVSIYLDTDASMLREEVMNEARELLPKDLPGVTSTVGWNKEDGGGGNQLNLTLHGRDTETLAGLAHEVARRVKSADGVMATHIDMENLGADEVRLRLDREALSRYGLSGRDVGRTIAFAMRGSTLRPIVQGDHEIAVGSRIALEDRDELDELLDFGVWSMATMQVVPVRALADVEMGKGPYSIEREARMTTTNVTVDLEEDLDLEEAFVGIGIAMDDMVLPQGYSWSKGRRYQEQQEEDASMAFAMFLSVAFIFLIMGTLFESFMIPLAIITTVPLAVLGAVWALYLSGTPFDTMAGVGMLVLIGVVVNNGIVLVDRVQQLRRDGVARERALVQAGRRRLRPILMTALTTICGLIPMAFGSSNVVGIPYAPLGRTVMGGLAAGTLLTLVVVPYVYTLLDDLSVRGMALLGVFRGKSPVVGETA
jgi:hydrophobic/amphiphilic exporter-1 (mainly G- bacteria), HAE1 family